MGRKRQEASVVCTETAPTGWPPPDLMQDDHRKLFAWFAGRPGSRRLVREALAQPTPGRSAAREGMEE